MFIATHHNYCFNRHISALSGKTCKSGQKVRALAFNKGQGEFAALTLNGYIHIWSAETFKQVSHVIFNVIPQI